MRIDLRKENAITLVALIITIVILVILAAVSIKMIYEMNFIDTAIEGAEKYQTEQYKEINDISSINNNVKDAAYQIENVKNAKLSFENIGTLSSINETAASVTIKAVDVDNRDLIYTLYWSEDEYFNNPLSKTSSVTKSGEELSLEMTELTAEKYYYKVEVKTADEADITQGEIKETTKCKEQTTRLEECITCTRKWKYKL